MALKIKYTLRCLVCAIIICSCDNSKTNATVNCTTTTNNAVVNSDTVKTEDDATKLANAIVGAIEEGIDNKHRNDSIRNANKTRMWVYQIGAPINDDKLAGQTLDKLGAIPNLCIFKKSRGEYYIIKDDGYDTKEQLLDSIASVKKQLAVVSTDRVEIVDLSIQCSSKRQPTTSGPIKYKVDGDRKEAKCLVCD